MRGTPTRETAMMRGTPKPGRCAFTLLELLVAVVVTGVIALLVYGSAQAGLDARTRLVEANRSLQMARALQATLEDALRNARRSQRAGEAAFVLEDRRDARGRPADQVRFVSAGALAPLSPGDDWAVVVEPTPEGLTLVALPIGRRAPSRRVVGPLPGITGLDVRLLHQHSDSGWRTRWPVGSAMPRAVELTYWSDAGPVGTPLRVALPLGGGIAR